MKKIFFASSLLLTSMSAFAGGPYDGTVTYLKTTSLGGANNTVYISASVDDSPCIGTNQDNRFVITNEVQHTVALSALLSGKSVRIYGNGECEGDTEVVGSISVS
ncbi:hypothetical protein [Microbulbifer taiwanensis]|uniref:DUF5666 domain-containing protein n=1 Tax=Microbulbifer taiwanensis TaxID=986746 RepID=A0ABW1YRL1_9GAMM|nr:hypothetical protein [Microbulbifer taiwanensis]